MFGSAWTCFLPDFLAHILLFLLSVKWLPVVTSAINNHSLIENIQKSSICSRETFQCGKPSGFSFTLRHWRLLPSSHSQTPPCQSVSLWKITLFYYQSYFMFHIRRTRACEWAVQVTEKTYDVHVNLWTRVRRGRFHTAITETQHFTHHWRGVDADDADDDDVSNYVALDFSIWRGVIDTIKHFIIF